jgi:hypothetical protein
VREIMGHTESKKNIAKKLLFKVCHSCGHCLEVEREPDKCPKCNKAFLPLQYFDKIHSAKGEKYVTLFERCEDLEEEVLIKGLYVLW